MKKKSGGVFSILLAFIMTFAMVVPTSMMQAYAANDTASCELKVTKVLEGGTLEANQFEFKIEAVTEGAPMPEKPTAKNDAQGNVSFGNATYSTAGTYEYKVTEVKGNDSSITYDTDAKTIKVTVTENDSGEGEQATPNNGTGYLPKKHTVSTSGSPVKVKYSHEGDLDGGYYSPKWVTFENNDVEHVFCGASYKSASSSNYQERTVWNADSILGDGIINYAGLSGLDAASFGQVKRHLDCVSYLYSNTYRNYDYDNASGAWPNSTDPDVMTGWALRDAVQKVMWNCYPYNAAEFTNVDALRKTTQEALFFILKCGKGYKEGNLTMEDSEFYTAAPDQEMFKAVVDYALKGTNNGKMKNYPDDTETYVYWNVLIQEGTGLMAITKETAVAQPLIGIYAPWEAPSLKAEATTAEFKNKVSTPDDSDKSTLKTTVSCDGKSGSADAAAEVKVPAGGAAKDVTDKIDYTGLKKDATYKVSGSLWEVKDGKVVGDSAVATVTEEKKAEAADGTWEITFKNVKLELGKSYVVFEEATLVKDAEGNDVTDGETIEHKNPEDKAQTVVVTEKEDGEDGPYLKTEAKNTYISPAEDQSITDEVEYGGLTSGEDYVLVGVLKNKTTGETVSSECKPVIIKDASESGVEFMDFSKIDASEFSDGDQIVVFEYLYEGTEPGTPGDGTEIAKHADINDKAQTVTVVDGKITLKKTTDVKNAEVGDVVPYKITVSSTRNITSVVNLGDYLGDNLEFVSASDGGTVESDDEKTVFWFGLEVPANGSTTVTIKAKITGGSGNNVVNEAYVSDDYNFGNPMGSDDDSAVLGVYKSSNNSGSKTSKTKGAKTGDATKIALFVVVLILAAALTATMIVRRRRSGR